MFRLPPPLGHSGTARVFGEAFSVLLWKRSNVFSIFFVFSPCTATPSHPPGTSSTFQRLVDLIQRCVEKRGARGIPEGPTGVRYLAQSAVDSVGQYLKDFDVCAIFCSPCAGFQGFEFYSVPPPCTVLKSFRLTGVIRNCLFASFARLERRSWLI